MPRAKYSTLEFLLLSIPPSGRSRNPRSLLDFDRSSSLAQTVNGLEIHFLIDVDSPGNMGANDLSSILTKEEGDAKHEHSEQEVWRVVAPRLSQRTQSLVLPE